MRYILTISAILLIVMALAAALAPSASHAQTLTTLGSFDDGTTNRTFPESRLTLGGSTLYGTTSPAGLTSAGGTVFSVPITGGTPKVLATFDGTNGAGSVSGLTLVGSTLYGTTNVGGAHDAGTVFSVPITGGTPTVLTSFDVTDGAEPSGELTLVGSTLYGTTENGGAHSGGTLFSIPITGGTPTVLASFNTDMVGYDPVGGLTLVGSTFYGAMSAGGPIFASEMGDPKLGGGTVYSIPITGGTPTVLAAFHSLSNSDIVPTIGGSGISGGLTLVGSTLYGTTEWGGPAHAPLGDGTVFSVPITGGTPTVLISFSGGTTGTNPIGGLTLVGSTLYGTTNGDGPAPGGGTIFSVPITNGTPGVLIALGDTGSGPEGRLTLVGSTLYGTTAFGGTHSDGAVFALTVPEPGTLTLAALACLLGVAAKCSRNMRNRGSANRASPRGPDEAQEG